MSTDCFWWCSCCLDAVNAGCFTTWPSVQHDLKHKWAEEVRQGKGKRYMAADSQRSKCWSWWMSRGQRRTHLKQLIFSCLLHLHLSSTHRSSSSPCGLQSPLPDGVKRGHLWPDTLTASSPSLLSISAYDFLLCVALLFVTSFTSIFLVYLLSVFSQTPTRLVLIKPSSSLFL